MIPRRFFLVPFALACAAHPPAVHAQSYEPSPAQDRKPLSPQDKESLFQDALSAYENNNYSRAFNLWLQLAHKHDPAAMRNLGHMLRKGDGVDKDPQRALDFYERAAQHGLVAAQLNAAYMHLHADGVEQNFKRAAGWFRSAADAGDPVGAYEIARMTELGQGVSKSIPKAAGWYWLAARKGHPGAFQRLGELALASEHPHNPSP